jgi:hypothetical protein
MAASSLSAACPKFWGDEARQSVASPLRFQFVCDLVEGSDRCGECLFVSAGSHPQHRLIGGGESLHLAHGLPPICHAPYRDNVTPLRVLSRLSRSRVCVFVTFVTLVTVDVTVPVTVFVTPLP